MSLHRKIKSDEFPIFETKRKQSTPRTSLNVVPTYEFNLKLPKLADLPKGSRENLFVRKVKLCSETFNFLEATMMKEKKLKTTTLKELVAFVREEGNVSILTESTYHEIVDMVAQNIFRTFPPTEYVEYEPEYDQATEEAAWPHLKSIYDFFLHFINSPELNNSFLKKAVTRSFITQLLEVFNTEDGRERKCLKNLVLTIYLKIIEQRVFIRKQIRNIFLRYVYEVEQFNGIAELLEIMGLAINGFSIPLRKDHQYFLNKVLMPLHIPRYVAFYHDCLVECLKGFLRKDENLAEEVFARLLKFWPKTCSEKQSLFLQEVIALLAIVSNEQFMKFHERLMKQIALSVSSLHHQVAETALNMWDNPCFYNHFNNNIKTLMPIIFPCVYQISTSHWNSNILELAKSTLQVFNKADANLYKKLEKSYKAKAKKAAKQKKKKKKK